MQQLTHLNTAGEAHMVDVSGKTETDRTAEARSVVQVTPIVLSAITNDKLPKGDLYASARIAGIQAAKRCSELIPLCHSLPLSSVVIEIELKGDCLLINVVCKTMGRTGVEMEALTAASIAALTIYDMCKGLDKGVVIRDTRLIRKSGGKSGEWYTEEGYEG